jgi:hypothetical protein
MFCNAGGSAFMSTRTCRIQPFVYYPILIHPLLQLKKVRRCEAQATHFVFLPFLFAIQALGQASK